MSTFYLLALALGPSCDRRRSGQSDGRAMGRRAPLAGSGHLLDGRIRSAPPTGIRSVPSAITRTASEIGWYPMRRICTR